MRAKCLPAIVAVVVLCGFARADAKEVGYPQQAPRFTIVVPETWKPVFRDDSLTLLPIPEDGFVIQVNQQPSAAEELLDKLTERIAAQMQFTEIKLGKDSEAENQHEVECTMMTSTGKSGGVDVVITAVAFTLDDEQHFTIQSAGPAALAQKHKGVLLGLIDSIKPIEEE